MIANGPAFGSPLMKSCFKVIWIKPESAIWIGLTALRREVFERVLFQNGSARMTPSLHWPTKSATPSHSLMYLFICSFWFQRFHYYFRYYYYYSIYLFILKFSPLNNSSKFWLPNLIFDLKNFTIYVHSFKYYFRYYFIYLFILKILKFPSLNKFSEFRHPILISNFKNSTIHSHLFNDYFCYYYYPIHLFIHYFIYLKSHL